MSVSNSLSQLDDIKMHPFTLEQCIWIIRNMPDLYLEHSCGIITDWETRTDAGKLLAYIRKVYIAKATWLEYFLLNYVEHALELTITDKKNFKPDAEETVAVYRLAQEVWLRSELNTVIPSPASWMLLVEQEAMGNIFRNIGYLDKAKPTSKSKMYRDICANSDMLMDVSWLEPAGTIKMSFGELLFQEAIRIAKEDAKFDERHYIPFWKTIKRCRRKIERSNGAAGYLDDRGKLQFIKRGKRHTRLKNQK